MLHTPSKRKNQSTRHYLRSYQTASSLRLPCAAARLLGAFTCGSARKQWKQGEKERRTKAMTTHASEQVTTTTTTTVPAQGTFNHKQVVAAPEAASALQRLIVQRCRNQNTERTRSGHVDSSNMRSRARRGAGHARGQGPCQL
jgi:hypothetical protein